ncbi:MAG: hypothetical protein LBQ01_05135 [Prevotellaceae bacterium]|nr:hypothetical protein [Prevotellaceae bacterium]
MCKYDCVNSRKTMSLTHKLHPGILSGKSDDACRRMWRRNNRQLFVIANTRFVPQLSEL